MSDFGFRVSCLRFGQTGADESEGAELAERAKQCLGFTVSGFGLRVLISGFRFQISGFGFRTSGFRFEQTGADESEGDKLAKRA